MKVGILTGGGDCPGLNAVIRSAVKTAQECYHWDVIGFLNGYKGLIENKTRPLTGDNVGGLLLRGGTILGTSNRDNPYKYIEIIGGNKVTHDVSDRVVEAYKSNGLDALIIVGGDGTLSTALQLYKHGAAMEPGMTGWIALGALVSFVVAVVVVKAFIAIINRFGFAPFGWYRIVAGIAALIWLGMR